MSWARTCSRCIPRRRIPGRTNNFVYSPAKTQFSHTFDVRVDHRFSDRDTLFARYSFNDVNTYTPGNLPDVSINGKTFGSQ